MSHDTPITVKATVQAPLEAVWNAWTTPEDITHWNAASDDWHTTRATADLRVGGTFTARMEAKDGSAGFDFSGTYSAVIPEARLAYSMEDGRKVEVTFEQTPDGVLVTETFDPEHENSRELQKTGWQAILDRFKTYVEQK